MLLASGVVSLAGGRVIAERTQGKYQITRLMSFGDTSTRLGKPRPVTFRGPQRTAEFGGRVAELGADAYFVVASAGDRLRAAISGFPTGSLWLRVSQHGSDKLLDGGRKGDSLWEARSLRPASIWSKSFGARQLRASSYRHLLSLSLTAQPLR